MLSHFSCVQVFVTLWTVDLQAPPSRGFSRQEYRSGLLCCPPGNLPDPGIKPISLMCPALAGGLLTTSSTWEAQLIAHGINQSLVTLTYIKYAQIYDYTHMYVYVCIYKVSKPVSNCASDVPHHSEFVAYHHCIGQPYSVYKDLRNKR